MNTGCVRNNEGLVNVYQTESRLSNEKKPGSKLFSKKQFKLYPRVRLKKLYFLAPTFITRLIGNESWTPADIDDEYWKTQRHYDYSGLLYLADYNEEFTGGLFSFIDESTETVIEPSRDVHSWFWKSTRRAESRNWRALCVKFVVHLR
ncbi:hypothetical protein PsorP6_012935 [Peronosclerospora sorghi]|uniref:Uncharacterized protein n=1 Tax=Peronosclerospora sorghi TaxID=230839 RepID=A0ACC0WEP6_9STRA|nr:hypothetical protein PsorP6_012935 [Peronosclerospora sorghi]